MLEVKSQALLSLQDQAALYPVDMSFKDRLRQARKATHPKVTQAMVAKALEVSPQAVSGWERGEAMPEPDKLLPLGNILQVDVAWLLGESSSIKLKGETVKPTADPVKSLVVPKPTQSSLADVTDGSGAIPGSELVGDQDLPVFGTAQGGTGALIVSDRAVDWVVRPAPLLRVKDGYGMIVTGDSMDPAIKSGATALVNPHLPPRAGDLCVFRNHQDDGTVLVCIKELRRQTDTAWHVRQLNPRKDITLKKSEWQVCHVTVGSFYGR